MHFRIIHLKKSFITLGKGKGTKLSMRLGVLFLLILICGTLKHGICADKIQGKIYFEIFLSTYLSSAILRIFPEIKIRLYVFLENMLLVTGLLLIAKMHKSNQFSSFSL